MTLVYRGDIGSRLTISTSNTAMPITTVLTILIKKPSGTLLTKTPTVDFATGIITYDTISGDFGSFRFGIDYIEDDFTESVLSSETTSYELGSTITESLAGNETYLDNVPVIIGESITFLETVGSELGFTINESVSGSEDIALISELVSEIVQFTESISFTISSAVTELISFVESVILPSSPAHVCISLSCNLQNNKPVILHCRLKC